MTGSWSTLASAFAFALVAMPSFSARAEGAAQEPWEAAAAARANAPAATSSPATQGAPATQANASETKGDGAKDPTAKPPHAMGGYTFSDLKPSGHRTHAAHPAHARHRVGLSAASPAFSSLQDGRSELRVTLSQSTAVTERKAPGRIVYVIAGAHVARVNDSRPLVAVHFNTPLLRATLRNEGRDAVLITELRGQVAPTMRVDSIGSFFSLVVEYPAGSFAAQDAPIGNPVAADPQTAPKAAAPKAIAPRKAPRPKTAH